MKRVVAIVVTYNRKKLLLENIEALLNQKYSNLDILVVDNHSSDGTKSALKQYINKDKIMYVDTGNNLGGAGGFQFGINLAANMDYDNVWIMDDDCMPKPDALLELMKVDEQLNGNYGFLSSRVLWKDGTLCTMNVQRKSLTRSISTYSKPLIEVVLASFVSLLIPMRVIRDVGLPIKEFFIWTDDWEYTRRISKKYPSYVVSNSVAVHKSAKNVGANIALDDVSRINRYKYIYRNDVFFYRQEGIKGILYDLIRLGEHTFRILFKAKDNKVKRLRIMYKGTMDGWKFKPSIEKIHSVKEVNESENLN